MMRRLEFEALRADLAAVEALLKQRSEIEDPIGWFQFNQRKAELESKIAELQTSEVQSAAVALYFGGRPVIEFAGYFRRFWVEGCGGLPVHRLDVVRGSGRASRGARASSTA